MDERTLIDKAAGCLVGVALGDALGMPVEMMTAEEIAAAGGVHGFMRPIQTRIGDTFNLPAGATTDDTQLTIAVAESLIRCGGFDGIDQARSFIESSRSTMTGWGKATRLAIKDMGEWFDSGGERGRSPLVPVPPPTMPGQSAGNGVAMKISPLAIWEAARYGSAAHAPMKNSILLGRQTHGDIRASRIAAVLAGLINMVLSEQGSFPTEQGIGIALAMSCSADIMTPSQRDDSDTVYGRLCLLEKALHLDERGFRETVGNGCFCLESVPYAIGVFLRHPTDFKAGLLEAANGGGDSDSTASMAGALIGANIGLERMPLDWMVQVPDSQKMIDGAERLVRAAIRTR